MERMNRAGQLDLLRRANAQLGDFFARCGAAVQGTEEEIQTLIQLERALRSVGVLLDAGLEESTNRVMQDEFIVYRANLVRLRSVLGTLQKSAAGTRARLFVRQKHLQAARQWSAAARASGA